MLPLLLAALLATDTTQYVILNHGRRAGETTIARTGDTLVVRTQFLDRNRGYVSARSYRVDHSGKIVGGESLAWVWGGEIGAPNDRFEIGRDSAVYGIGRQTRSVWAPDMFPRLRAASSDYDLALQAKFLLGRPDHKGRLMPGELPVSAEVITTAMAPTKSGAKHVRFVGVYTNTTTDPEGIWLDDAGEMFAGGIGWFITVRPGAEQSLPVLRAAEMKWRNAQGLSLAKSLPRAKEATVVIRNGDLFDSERGVMVPKTTVVIKGEKIAAVGAAADSMPIPADAQIIDATGKTVMPGMWDMHGHLQHTSQVDFAVRQLAIGLTTVRDMASDIDVATWYRDQVNAGNLLGPRAILSGFMEGPELWSGPTDVLLSNEAEARTWVAKYDSMGYKQIKLYNLIHPDLVPVIAAEAHKRGMRLSGHIPRGLSVPAAITLGFDEIQHAAFLFSTFYEDSLFMPKMRAYSQVASVVAPNVNVDGPEFTALVDFMHQHHTVLDGTYAIWTSTASAAVGAPPVDMKGVNNYYRTITRLDSAGVTLVPGTDNPTSSTYVNELECYVHAGLPAAKVLQMATITSARVMRDDANYGSIVPGKVADVIVVNGKPIETIGDLRKVDEVIRAGRVYTPAELKKAIGAK
jgi:imidazolonepropionase-like amidohydrolase